MAASEVDIVNMALGHLGDRANVTSISPSDGTVQADAAAREYAPIRDWLLEQFAWKFALRRATLAERADITVGSYAHVYTEPNNCVRLLAILPGGYTSDQQNALYDTETDATGQPLILTDAEDAVARYIHRVTDPGKFSPGFTVAFSWFLAASLAGPIVKGETGRQESARCIQFGTSAFATATSMSLRQARIQLQHLPSNIAARGATVPADESFPIRSV